MKSTRFQGLVRISLSSFFDMESIKNKKQMEKFICFFIYDLKTKIVISLQNGI